MHRRSTQLYDKPITVNLTKAQRSFLDALAREYNLSSRGAAMRTCIGMVMRWKKVQNDRDEAVALEIDRRKN